MPKSTQNKLQILFEDNHLIVVVKPFNILTQSDKTGDLNLYSQVKKYIKDKYHKPGNVYLGLVHRLDRPVSGIIVFAKTSKAASRLSEQIRVGDMTKKYLALCTNSSYGRPLRSPSWHTLIHYLQKNPHTNITSVSDNPKQDYKKSILKFKIANDINSINYSLFIINSDTKHKNQFQNTIQNQNISQLEIKLLTGRSHQIRAQLSHIGLPILGDIKYGSNIALPNKNIALVAYQLAFCHPVSKQKLNFKY